MVGWNSIYRGLTTGCLNKTDCFCRWVLGVADYARTIENRRLNQLVFVLAYREDRTNYCTLAKASSISMSIAPFLLVCRLSFYRNLDPRILERLIDFSVRTPNPASDRERTQTPSVNTIRPMAIARIARTASAIAILSCRISWKYCLLLSLLSTPLLGVRKKNPGLPLIPCKKPKLIAVAMHKLV